LEWLSLALVRSPDERGAKKAWASVIGVVDVVRPKKLPIPASKESLRVEAQT
jgi:hypothetical protein